jgi:hypothetical protein
VCIFCEKKGQTGSGKTYTMANESSGIIPLAVKHVFHYIETFEAEQACLPNSSSSFDTTSFSLFVSYLEIYNEKIRDLLVDSSSSSSSSTSAGDNLPVIDSLIIGNYFANSGAWRKKKKLIQEYTN